MSDKRVSLAEVQSQLAPKWLCKPVLLQFCMEHGLKVTSRMKKAQLYDVIRDWANSQLAAGLGDPSVQAADLDAFVLDFTNACGSFSSSVAPKPDPAGGPAGVQAVSGCIPVSNSFSGPADDSFLRSVLAQLTQQVSALSLVVSQQQTIPSSSGAGGTPVLATNASSFVSTRANVVHPPGLKLSHFSGDVDKVDPFDWLNSLHTYARVAQLSDGQLLEMVPLFLTGEAAAKWQDLTPDSRVSWEATKNAWLDKLIGEKRGIFRVRLSA
jgi:hypothetical protein